jgi:glutathione S-transferase
VRLTAVEKGCKWKHFEVNHVKNEHTAPWYVKLNPKTYVPTMLVEGNKSVCESMEIAKYIDKNFKGKVQLDREINENPQIKERYDIFLKMIDDLMVEPFSMGSFNRGILADIFPIMFLK